MNALGGIFETDHATQRMEALLAAPTISQVTVNRFDKVFYTDASGVHLVERVFATPEEYTTWLSYLLTLTDAGYADVASAKTSIIEASFSHMRTPLQGSIHLCTSEVTRGDPALTIRKQPRDTIRLEQMLDQGMLSEQMLFFLQIAVRGRTNILISGGSGAGKTTLARALSWYIDASHRVVTAEDIDELHLEERLPNVVPLTTYRMRDSDGVLLRETSVHDLVYESLRMRPDRIWVGEIRGKEAYALVKACNTGHDGAVTTIHGDDSQQAAKQLITYVMEASVPEEVARDSVARAFQLVVQISKARMGQRRITEITELEPVREGNEQRRNSLFLYDDDTDTWTGGGRPSKRLTDLWARHGVNGSEFNAPLAAVRRR